jgi:hypothetical protein
MGDKKSDDQFSEEETIARAEAALKRMLSTPPKPHSEMKVGKLNVKASAKASQAKRDRRPNTGKRGRTKAKPAAL